MLCFSKMEIEEILQNDAASFAIEGAICSQKDIDTGRQILSETLTAEDAIAETVKIQTPLQESEPTETGCYPGTFTLVNKYGIKDVDFLNKVETSIAFYRTCEMEKFPIKGNFNFWYLKDIHGKMFKDLYDWAGEERTIQIKKPRGSFNDFSYPEDIARNARRIFNNVRENNFLIDKPLDQTLQMLSQYLADINYLHPFREGNGRATRVFIQNLAKCAGIQLNWAKTNQDEIYQASIETCHGDNQSFYNVLKQIAQPYPPNKQLNLLRETSPVAFKIFEHIHELHKLPDREHEFSKA